MEDYIAASMNLEGTSVKSYIYQMMMAEYRTYHSEEELREATSSVLVMNFLHSQIKERRLAKLIGREVDMAIRNVLSDMSR